MSSIREDIQNILENRKIHSEIRLREDLARIRTQYPELTEVEQEIASLTEQQMLLSLDGKSDETLEDKIRDLDKRRETVMRKYGLTSKDFEAKPFCSLCGDTGFITEVTDSGRETQVPCTCICGILAPTYLEQGGIDRYPDVAFEKASASFFEGNPAAGNVFLAVKTLAEKRKMANLVLFGPSGTGKTFMAVSAARCYAEKGIPSMVIRMADAQELMMEYRKNVQSFYTNQEKERSVTMRRNLLVEADLLVLDDLGVEIKTPNSEADLLYILDTRAQMGRKTIITTNYDLNSLKERYGGRVYERLAHSFKIYKVPGREG